MAVGVGVGAAVTVGAGVGAAVTVGVGAAVAGTAVGLGGATVLVFLGAIGAGAIYPVPLSVLSYSPRTPIVSPQLLNY